LPSGANVLFVDALSERSPSALRRLLEREPAVSGSS